MKIESLLVQYLYNHKSLTLQGIGTFTLHTDIPQQTDAEKQPALPENAVSFEENAYALQDDRLIEYIVQQTRKIKPLATSDLESFSILSKEYLNIGKPFTLDGVGTLLKNQHGHYEFTQGGFINPKLASGQSELREKEAGTISFSTPPRKSGNNRNMLIGSLILLMLLIIPGIIYYYYQKKPAPVVSEANMIPKNVNDSIPAKDSLPVKTTAVENDTLRYLVVKTYSDSTRANREVKRLTSYNHHVKSIQKDSSTYYVVMPFAKTIADTTLVKDSINRLFAVKAFFLP